ncbi:MCP four helix bundle domain-containing protein [Xanthomonas sacchari]
MDLPPIATAANAASAPPQPRGMANLADALPCPPGRIASERANATRPASELQSASQLSPLSHPPTQAKQGCVDNSENHVNAACIAATPPLSIKESEMPRYIDLRTSLVASLFCVLGCVVAVAVAKLSIDPLDSSRAHLRELQTHAAPSAMALRELRAQLAELRLYQLSLIDATGNAEDVADYDRRIEQSLQGVQTQLARYLATDPSEEERVRFAKVRSELDAYLQLHQQIAAAVHAGDRERARQLSTQQALPQRRAMFSDLLELGRVNAESARKENNENDDLAAR